MKKLKSKLLEYISHLEKKEIEYLNEKYQSFGDDYHFVSGLAISVRATINDLYDILADRTYDERIKEYLGL